MAVHDVLARTVPAVLGRAERTPGDAKARRVEAGEGAFEAFDLGQQLRFGHFNLVHDDFAGDRGAQAELAVNGRGGQALHAFFQDEAADLAIVGLGPDDEHVGDG